MSYVSIKGISKFGRISIVSFLCFSLTLPIWGQQGGNKKASGQLQASSKDAPPSRSATADPNYVIGPQDVIDISVWKEPELSRSVPVRPDGKISLPLVNDVQAAGLTPGQLGAQITSDLTKYMTSPQVTVIVAQINSQRIYVLGEVTRAGSYTLLPDMTVLQALSDAGGFTAFANSKRIYVLRQDNGKQQKIPFNYKDVISGKDPSQNVALRAGDTIIVP
jgi:polysaccharide export outer membrane protein